MVGETGFEPATPRSQTACATSCATPRNVYSTEVIIPELAGKRKRLLLGKFNRASFTNNRYFDRTWVLHS